MMSPNILSRQFYKVLRYPHIHNHTHRTVSLGCLSTSTDKTTDKKTQVQKTKNFKQMLQWRQSQAKASVLIEVISRHHCPNVWKYCKEFGNINEMFYYNAEKKDVCLVEYSDPDSVKKLLDCCDHSKEDCGVPVNSRLLKIIQGDPLDLDCPIDYNSYKVNSETEIQSQLASCSNISEEMSRYYELTKLSDLQIRLKFLTCLQIVDALSGMFPYCEVFPFGSSINGFGRNKCDLDMILTLHNVQAPSNPYFQFQPKGSLSNDRMQMQRTLETLGDLCHNFLPGITNIQRILLARVPILKFEHQLTGMQCDLSVYNLSGLFMSEILYLFGEIDPRVRPLVFSVRKWANACKLTNEAPGRWITNFSLTLMVIFFLQTKSILPPMEKLMDSIDALQNFKMASTNSEELVDLLKGFFLFYKQLDYRTKALSIIKGTIIPKPDYSALYIENPVDYGLNVSKNFTLEELERLKEATADGLWVLEYAENEGKLFNLFEVEKKDSQKRFQVQNLFKDRNFRYEVVAKSNKQKKNITKEHVKNK